MNSVNAVISYSSITHIISIVNFLSSPLLSSDTVTLNINGVFYPATSDFFLPDGNTKITLRNKDNSGRIQHESFHSFSPFYSDFSTVLTLSSLELSTVSGYTLAISTTKALLNIGTFMIKFNSTVYSEIPDIALSQPITIHANSDSYSTTFTVSSNTFIIPFTFSSNIPEISTITIYIPSVSKYSQINL